MQLCTGILEQEEENFFPRTAKQKLQIAPTIKI